MALPERIQLARRSMRGFVDSYDWSSLSDRRLGILKTFLALAASQGYSAVSMRTLADAVQMRAPSIYSHFPAGKEEIIAQSLRWQASVYGRAVLAATEHVASTDEFLVELARCHCRMNVENRENSLWDMILAADRVGKFLPMDLRSEMYDWIEICATLYRVIGEENGVAEAGLNGRQALAAIDAVHGWSVWDGTDAGLTIIQEQAVRLARRLLGADGLAEQA